jgi:hypothetical protein
MAAFIHILVFQHLVSNDQSLHGSENTHNLTSFTGAKYSTRDCKTLFNIIRAQNPHYHGQPIPSLLRTESGYLLDLTSSDSHI